MTMGMRKKLKMGNGSHSQNTGWEDLPEDILRLIFDRLLPKHLFKSVYSVCRSWRSVSRLRVFWYPTSKYLELSRFTNIGMDDTEQFMKLVTSLLDEVDRKSEIISGIAFPGCFYLSDKHLFDIAQRLPKLNRLFLPNTTNMITRKGFSQTIRLLTDIREIRIGQLNLSDYIYFIQEIGANCKNLEHLVISCASSKSAETVIEAKDSNVFVLDECTSRKIANSLGKVEHIDFFGCVIYKAGLKNIMSNCHRFKDANIMWCKHMMSLTPKESYPSYKLRKRFLKDNSIGWSATTLKKGMCAYPDWTILKLLWGEIGSIF